MRVIIDCNADTILIWYRCYDKHVIISRDYIEFHIIEMRYATKFRLVADTPSSASKKTIKRMVDANLALPAAIATI